MNIIAAAVQMVSQDDVADNLAHCAHLIQKACAQQAELVVLPEHFATFALATEQKIKVAEAFGDGPIQNFLRQQAKQNHIWLVGGSIPLQAATQDRVYSSCLLYNPQGECVARYDKIHLFDVSVQDSVGEYEESKTVQAGEKVVVVATPFGKLGLSICYDVRFPELYRSMLNQGVEIIVLPSAFTYVTGKAHWDILLHARAIENLCFVIAPNQGGKHVNGRETYGHSCMIDPWGHKLAQAEMNEAVIVAKLDRDEQDIIRQKFPALTHRVGF